MCFRIQNYCETTLCNGVIHKPIQRFKCSLHEPRLVNDLTVSTLAKLQGGNTCCNVVNSLKHVFDCFVASDD